MTVPIAQGSPRLLAAKRFGDALQVAMQRRKVGQVVLAAAAHVGRSAVVQWRMGRNLPTMETARRLSEALGDEHLLELVRQGRTLNCRRCGKEFVHDGGGPRAYCSELCMRTAQALRIPDQRHPRTKLAAAKLELKAIRADARAVSTELSEHQLAVGAMCRSCEPEGYCRTAECALRPISPLKLRIGPRIAVDEAVTPGGAWSPAHRQRQLDAIRAANEKRWNREGEKEGQAVRTKARFAAMTEEERQAWIESIKVGRRKSA